MAESDSLLPSSSRERSWSRPCAGKARRLRARVAGVAPGCCELGLRSADALHQARDVNVQEESHLSRLYSEFANGEYEPIKEMFDAELHTKMYQKMCKIELFCERLQNGTLGRVRGLRSTSRSSDRRFRKSRMTPASPTSTGDLKVDSMEVDIGGV